MATRRKGAEGRTGRGGGGRRGDARRRSRFLCSISERDRTCTDRASSRRDRTSPAPRARAVPRAQMPHGSGPPNEIGDASGTRGSSSARRASSPVWRSSDRAPGPGVSSHDPGWRGEAPARALPPRGTRGPPRPRILRARKDALPRWAGARVARGPGCAAGRRARPFRSISTTSPRSSEVSTSIISGQHDLPSPTPGLVVLVCKSSFGDLKNTLNEISPIEHFVFDRLLRVEHFFDRLVVDASPTCLPCYEIQQKLHLAEYGRAESMTHTQVRASRSLLRHSFVALPTGRGGALSPLPPDVVDVVLRDAARGTFRDAHDFRWRALSRVPARGADRGSRSRREMSRRRLARRGARSRPCVRGRLFALDLRRPRPGSGDGGAPLRYEIVQGALVRWSAESPSGPHPPTAVLIHGILGSRRNLLSFANRLAQAFPSWQFVLVDLRCHGQTASMPDPPAGENSVVSAAKDVLGVLNHLKIYPHTLLGHSFGGKVAMSMVHQFGKQLPRPVQVRVLDTVPGDVWCEAGDHPRDTIVRAHDRCPSRRANTVDSSWRRVHPPGAQWMTTNLTPRRPPRRTASSRGRSTSRASSTCTRATGRRTCGRVSRRAARVGGGLCAPRRAPSCGRPRTSRIGARREGALPAQQLALGAHR